MNNQNINQKPSSVLTELEKQHQAANTHITDGEIASLRALAAKNRSPVKICEGSFFFCAAIMAVSAFFFFIGYFAIFEMSKKDPDMVNLGYGAIGFGCIAFLGFLRLFLRYGTPLVTFKEDGLVLPLFKETIPWPALEHFYIAQGRIYTLDFQLIPGFNPGTPQKCKAKFKYDPNNNLIVARTQTMNKSLNRYFKIFSAYQESGNARTQLHSLGLKF